MYCMYVHTCVHMLLHLQVLKSIHMCMYCMYWHTCVYMCIHVYICRPHTGHIYPFVCRCPQQARNIPGGGRQPAGPTPDGHGQQPCHFIPRSGTHPQTHFGALVRAARVGGGKRSPPVQPMGPPRAMGTRRARPEPRPELIWVGSTQHRGRVRAQQRRKNPSLH